MVLQTEACNGVAGGHPQGPIIGDWGRARRYAEDLLRGLEAGISGWMEWNIALNLAGAISTLICAVFTPFSRHFSAIERH